MQDYMQFVSHKLGEKLSCNKPDLHFIRVKHLVHSHTNTKELFCGLQHMRAGSVEGWGTGFFYARFCPHG